MPVVAHSPLDLDRDRGLDPPSSPLPPHPRRLAPWPDRPRPPQHRASTPSPLDTDRRPTLPRRSPELLRLVCRPVLVSPSTAPPSHAYPLPANAGEGLALPSPTVPHAPRHRPSPCQHVLAAPSTAPSDPPPVRLSGPHRTRSPRAPARGTAPTSCAPATARAWSSLPDRAPRCTGLVRRSPARGCLHLAVPNPLPPRWPGRARAMALLGRPAACCGAAAFARFRWPLPPCPPLPCFLHVSAARAPTHGLVRAPCPFPACPAVALADLCH
nr:vegetative cell wall protein gp1-like [Aegilops tauschii subsp. strangulata]